MKQKVPIKKKAQIVTIFVALTIGVASGILLQKYLRVSDIPMAIMASHRAQSLAQATQKSEGNIPEEFIGKLQLFIFAGQSNMSGRGDIRQSETSTNPRVYVFGNDYRWRLAKEPIDDSSNQVDEVFKDLDAGFSPATSFATKILERHPNMVIGLIPCAKGGKSIDDWQRNLSDNTLYGSCLKRVRAASTMGDIAGLLFYQGTLDALDPMQFPSLKLLPNQWADKFTAFISNWRDDLNLPALPVVFAQIGTNKEPDIFKNWAIVQEQQRAVRLPFCTMITTDDLTLEDAVHFTNESYKKIGQRFAQAYLDLR